ncbi:glutamate formimidoyltransferase [Acetohalobium arabaticum]|uniref:glutamate formimidoyltransferase n=1 Tax=Acetohalobium arabaticum (strain ATCC 49924 / DSM 5501 / Z-7288) TaxID=574087 RepID=D9QSH7_ACEAZ|nr:glutamate formimidoyltransferase [Acetohalobium arabaticum]ADL13440.1 glutamate formiminotransferase [Acetohalobium arabaticum DSM 5501]
MAQILECIPNFSEGQDEEKIEKIVQPFKDISGVKLLDYSADKDHNRLVVTMIGSPDALKKSVLEAMEIAVDLIDMNEHAGEHPRMGAVDVVPFTPVRGVTMEEAVELANEVAQEASEKMELPIYLYEEAATTPERKNLADIRRGEFEGFADKIQQPEWKPDYGPAELHSTAGASVIGARMPLVAFNVNLDTDDLEIANEIARKVRHSGGGLRYCKAIGIDLNERGITQVSMNMTDYTKTALYQSYEMVKFEAERYGVDVIGSELIGLLPAQALFDVAEYYLGVEDFSGDQIMENRLLEEL